MRARVGRVRGWRVRLAGRESERRARPGKAAQADTAAECSGLAGWLAGWLAGGRVRKGKVVRGRECKQADRQAGKQESQARPDSAAVVSQLGSHACRLTSKGRRRREERLLARNKVGVPRGW